MPNKSNWTTDTRPENIHTYTETSGGQTATYKLVDTHPIIGGILDKLAFFRTHAAAVWYDKIAGKSVKDKFDEIEREINNVSGTVETVDPMTATITGFAADALKTKEVIVPLQTKMTSFEQAKSIIAGSTLGKALGMTASTELTTVASKINSVANRGTLNWSGSNTTYSVSAGYYSGGTLDSRPSYNAGVTAADARVNSSSANYKGGYNAGVTAQDTTARSQLASALVSVGISATASETFAALLNKIKNNVTTYLNGSFTVSKVTQGNNGASYTVTFSKPFAKTPTIQLSARGVVHPSNASVSLSSVTKAGFTCWVTNTHPTNSQDITVTWNASV